MNPAMQNYMHAQFCNANASSFMIIDCCMITHESLSVT